MAGIDRAALRQKLAGRTAESYANKDSDSGFRTYLRPTNGRPVFKKLAEGQIMFDILPFVVSADFMLHPDRPGAPKYLAGEARYYLEVYSHMNIGTNNWNVCCPEKNFGLPCPICEEFRRLQSSGADWETVLKPLKLNRRCVYNIWMHDVPSLKEEAKGVQLLEIAHFSLEANILPLTRDPRTGASIEFACPDTGRTIYFERKGTKQDNTKYLGFQLLDRPEPIPDDILAQAVSLNEAIEVLDYEQLVSLFKGGTARTVEEQPQAAPERAPRRAPMSQVPQNAPVAAPEPQPEPTPAPAAAPVAPPRRAPAAPQAAPAAPAAAPVRRPAPQAQAAAPTPQAAPPAAAPAASADGEMVCPHGMTFGQDTDKIEECNTCDLYDDCGKAFDARS